MTADLQAKLLAGVKADVQDVIESAWDRIVADMGRAAVAQAESAQDDDGEFKYKLGITVTMIPHGDEYEVKSVAGWSVRRKCASLGTTVSNQTELPL